MSLRIIALPPAEPSERQQVRALAATAAEHDGFAALNEAALLTLADSPGPARDLDQRRAYDGDALVGYGQLRDGTGSLVVDPAHRRRGIGTALLTELLGSTEAAVAFWATRDTEAAQALAARHQLARLRELLIMSRSLIEPVESAPIPAGTEIRGFRIGADEDQWLGVNARAFAHHPEQGGITRSDLDQRIAQDWFDAAGFLVATRIDHDRETMIGFHWTKQHPDRVGEVYVIGVDPGRSGGGIGSALLTRGLAHLAERGNTEVILYTEGDNAGAIGLYQRYGFAILSRDVMYGRPRIHGG